MEQHLDPSFESTFSSSSKTASTAKSAVFSEKDRDMDLSKDNSASPIDLECHIQTDRIRKLVDEAIYKIKLAICLPDLVAEYKTLNRVLSTTHMDDLIFIFDQYDNPLFSASMLNETTVEDLKTGDLSLKNRLNPELAHLMYILNSYPELKTTILPILQEKRIASSDLLTANAGMEFLSEFELFRELIVKQLEITAADDLLTKINNRKLEQNSKQLIELIKEYTKKLKEESDRFEEIMSVKTQIITKLEQELTMLSLEATSKLQKKTLFSDRQMVLATRAHAVKTEMLQEEEQEARECYENVLKQHLREEKNQRARKLKVETQLLSWMQKYDIEMGEKQAELDEFTDKYETELDRCNKLQAALDVQDVQYLPLMEEREKEYHAEMTRKMEEFRLAHAAKIIQYYWRNMIANRVERKKLRKLYKKYLIKKEKEELKQEKLRRAAERAAKAAEKAAALAAKKNKRKGRK